ncbi:MAG: hypothetical protein WCK33_02040 [Phycisphaerae bacterium]
MSIRRLCVAVPFAAMVAGCVPALAQEFVPFPEGTRIRHLAWNEGVVTDLGFDEPYVGRAPTTYDSATTPTCGIYLTGVSNVIDDIDFGPIGPWATTTNNVIRTIRVPLANSGTTAVSYDFKVSVWDDANFAASPMIAATGTPLWTATYPVRNLAQGAYDITYTIAAGITVPDTRIYVQLQYFVAGSTTTQMSTATGQPARFYALNRITTGPGSSSSEWGIDINNDRTFQGGALGTTDRRTTNFPTGSPCVGQPMNLPIIITGDVPIVPPTGAVALGNVVDAAAPRTDALAAGAVKWYTFTLAGDISDAAATFLDIDTEGSTIPNTAMALFRPNGNRIATDELSGSGELANLSFGIGRRPADGDGAQYDGYDGQLLATDGPFYLAVCQGNATFSDGFVATPVATGQVAGNIRLRLRSNVVRGTLAPSVAPAGNELGTILSPGVQTVATLPGAYNAVWYKFSLCRGIDGSSADNYLDIDFGAGEGAADPVAYIFDGAGNVRFVSDDTDANNGLPIFSFGSAGPRAPYTPLSGTYTGQSGPIEGGEYWLAVGLFPINPLPDPAAGRWHLRPASGSNLNVRPDFYTGVVDCGSPCAACAADYNQDGGVDGGDLASFFPEWANAASCADVNQDGGVDGGDLQSFFLVWQAGGC